MISASVMSFGLSSSSESPLIWNAILLGSLSSPTRGLNSLYSPNFTFLSTSTHLLSLFLRSSSDSFYLIPVLLNTSSIFGYSDSKFAVWASFFSFKASLVACSRSLRSRSDSYFDSSGICSVFVCRAVSIFAEILVYSTIGLCYPTRTGFSGSGS